MHCGTDRHRAAIKLQNHCENWQIKWVWWNYFQCNSVRDVCVCSHKVHTKLKHVFPRVIQFEMYFMRFSTQFTHVLACSQEKFNQYLNCDMYCLRPNTLLHTSSLTNECVALLFQNEHTITAKWWWSAAEMEWEIERMPVEIETTVACYDMHMLSKGMRHMTCVKRVIAQEHKRDETIMPLNNGYFDGFEGQTKQKSTSSLCEKWNCMKHSWQCASCICACNINAWFDIIIAFINEEVCNKCTCFVQPLMLHCFPRFPNWFDGC